MATSDIITRTGLKPAILFGRQRSGDVDAAQHQPPSRSPTLGPRSLGVANTPCALDTGEIIERLGKMLAAHPAHPTHGSERLRRPVSGSATSSKWSPAKLHSMDGMSSPRKFRATGRVELSSRSHFHYNGAVAISVHDAEYATKLNSST